MLRRRRDHNSSRRSEIVNRHAADRGWTEDDAELYLGSLLSYDLGQRELKAMTVFWQKCFELGLIDTIRPLKLYQPPSS
jgi:predicted solute-binding protein